MRVQRVLHGGVKPEVALLEEIAADKRVFHRPDSGIGEHGMVAAHVDGVVRRWLEKAHHAIGGVRQSAGVGVGAAPSGLTSRPASRLAAGRN